MVVQCAEQMDFTECGYFGISFEKPKNFQHHQILKRKKNKTDTHTHKISISMCVIPMMKPKMPNK